MVYFLPKSNSTDMENNINGEKDVKFLPLIAIQDASYSCPISFILDVQNAKSAGMTARGLRMKQVLARNTIRTIFEPERRKIESHEA